MMPLSIISQDNWLGIDRFVRPIIERMLNDRLAGILSGHRVKAGVLSGTPPVAVQQAIDHGNLAGLADDDHPQYTTAAEATTIADTEAAAAVATHVGASDPHTQYQKESEKGAANGYAGLGANSLVPVAQLGTGAPDGSKFLRDDQTFAAPPGGSLAVQEIDGAPDVSNVTRIKVTNGTLTDDGGGTITLDFGSAATDGAAIHDNTASEISAITEKTTPVAADMLIIEDSADSNNKKMVQVGNLPSSGGDPSTMILSGAYASLPAAGTEGRLYIPTDSFYDFLRDTGAAWEHFLHGHKCTPPVVADFAWVNQGTATASATHGGILLTAAAAAGNSAKILKKAAPATPYTITVAVMPEILVGSYNYVGIGWRQSSDGKLVLFGWSGYNAHGTFGIQNYTNATTFNAWVLGASMHNHALWLRIADDGTNRICSASTNGRDFVALKSIGRTNFLTGDEVFMFAESNDASSPAVGTFLSWEQG